MNTAFPTPQAKGPSSGILLWRRGKDELEVLLAHPGGPYWEGTDLGAWSIPKGQHNPEEDEITAGLREFSEEVGLHLDPEVRERLLPLDEATNASGRPVKIWALEGDFDTKDFLCNDCTMEWPKGSGTMCSFPEMDAAEWFGLETATQKIFETQLVFLERLAKEVG